MGRLKHKDIFFQGILLLSFTIVIAFAEIESVSKSITPTTLLSNKSSIISPEIGKPPGDNKSYRGLTLSNGLQVLLISDPNVTKAGASLSVGVGSMNDPQDLPGLAHFLEHAIFLGDTKYPEENGFSNFLSANAGFSNAQTTDDSTTYYFDVVPSALSKALNRFGQFFISPLFRESSLEKEVNAINSEHEKNIPLDERRIFRIESETADPKHNFSVFGTGNRETLWTLPRQKGVNMSEALMDFFLKFYSANIMRLAVLSPQSLDEMQSTVEGIFLEIPNREIVLPFWHDPPLGSKEMQTKIEIVPQSDHRALYITIPIPYNVFHYKTNPILYVYSLIEHEGKGSLLSLLKKKNLARAISIEGRQIRGFTALRVKINLTPQGLNNTNQIICHLFEYIEMIKDLGPQKWYWDELKDINLIGYQFSDKADASSLLLSYTLKMLNYPLEDIVSAEVVLSEYQPKSIENVLNSLTPEKSRITLVSKRFESKANLREKYYGIKYNVEKIHHSIIQKWKGCRNNSEFHFPTKNEFIPSKFELKTRVEKPGIIPTIINETDLSTIWFLQDNEFFLPKAIFSVEIYSPMAYITPLSFWLNFIFAAFVKDSLSEFSYKADLADSSYSISVISYGINLRVEGYNDRLDQLLIKVIETMTNLNMFEVNPEQFEFVKDSFLRRLKNSENDEPKDRANKKLSEILTDKYWSNEDLLSVAKDVTIERVAQFSREFLSQLKLTWLFYGNLEPREALEMASACQKVFEQIGTKPILPSQNIRLRDVEIPQGTEWIYKMYQSSHSSSSVIILFQLDLAQNIKEYVMVELLRELMDHSFYDQLRTQEQLGYNVGTVTGSFEAINDFRFIVQGERHPAFIESRIDNFIKGFQINLKNMTQEKFTEHKDSFKVLLKSIKPKTLFERRSTIIKEIISERLDFDRNFKEEEELEKLTLKEFNQFFQENFGLDSKKKRMISMHFISTMEGGAGKNITQEDEILVLEIDSKKMDIGKDLAKWKNQRKLCPTH